MLDLVTVLGKLIGDKYINNHPLAARPVFMNDQARQQRSKAVTTYLQSETDTTLSLPAMIPDMNPIKHGWDMLDSRVHAFEPPVQNLRQLEAALYRGSYHSSTSTD